MSKKITVFGEEVSFIGFFLVVFLGLVLIGGCSYRVFFLKSVENYELAYKWDRSNGSITILNRSGWHRVTPFVTKINTIDMRPMQIRIEANNRVLNAMLVRFKKEGLMQFIDMHGRDDYDQTQLGEILKSYAYEGYGNNTYNRDSLEKKYKFLEILGGTTGTGNGSPQIVLFKDTTNAKTVPVN